MNFISAKDTALKWNISKARVIVYAKEGRIPGATKVGNSWMIPSDAKKPGDARTKLHSKSQNIFHFPLLVYAPYTTDAYKNTLSEEEKKLLKAQLTFESCDLVRANKMLCSILNSTNDLYIKIGTLYFLCVTAMYLNEPEKFNQYKSELKKILNSDFPYREEMKTVILDIEILTKGNSFFIEEFKKNVIDSYPLEILPFIYSQSAFCDSLTSFIKQIAIPAETISLLCIQLEKSQNYYTAQNIHMYMSTAYSNDHSKRLYHLEKALKIGIKINSLLTLSVYYPYMSPDFTEVFKRANTSTKIINKITSTADLLMSNIAAFCNQTTSNAEIINSFSEIQTKLLQLAVKGYSNKEVSDATELPEYTVRRHYEKLFNILNVSNKKALADLYLKIIEDGYQ